jgi:hypothetical protein
MTDINLASGAVRTFTIKGDIALATNGSLSVTAAMLRPADVTDPDATNPDAAPPSDAADECNAGGAGCNNLKVSTINVVMGPDAGPDQTVFQYATATMAATGQGTFTQAGEMIRQ